jgi:prenyl protein peptidase
MDGFSFYLHDLRLRAFSRATILAVVVGPLTEELLYRPFTCSMWEKAQIGWLKIVFLSPIVFGLSHFHHYFLGRGRNRLFQALFQCCFTTVFGWFASFVWCRTYSYSTCVIIHSFCNSMGFPDFQGAWNWAAKVEKIVIWGAYLLGLSGFVYFVAILSPHDS